MTYKKLNIWSDHPNAYISIYVDDEFIFQSMSEKLKAEKRSNLYKNIDFEGWRSKHSNR